MSAHPTLERTASGVAIVGRAGARVEIDGPAAERIATWHEHMTGHGAEVGATYLAGVVDGLSAAHAMRIRQVVAEAEARLAEGRRLIDEAQARQEARGHGG